MRIADFKALTFDCYGTLIDWECGLLAILRPWADRYNVSIDDDGLLAEFANAESACEGETPHKIYTDILRDVHRRMAQRLGIQASDQDADMLAASVGAWPPFADTVDALKELKKTHKLAIISNVDRRSFARTNKQLQVEFDAIITAEDVGAYKPDHRMFLRAFEVLAGMGIERGEILHVAQSLYHDHEPAKTLGLMTAWVDRRGKRPGYGATKAPHLEIAPDLTVRNMAELVT